ncbi:glycosyltransferase family 2 protein [Candidatus Woesearchaeota archaeon]|nr:glycosyltransferase family 2 protein [Candidatus Woesearchaeota archaeon]
MEKSNIWAVIPAYNEEKSIAGIIKKTRLYAGMVVVVNDGSKDKTKDAAENAGAAVLTHVINLGKGAALKTGCDYAVRKGAKHIVALDADAQHNPEDIPRFADKLKKYDIVFSYRKASRKMPFVLRFGNWFISNVVKALYGISLNDTQCGFRAFSGEAYKKIRWNAPDYSMESEMITRAGKQRLKYVQIPIETIYSDKYKGTTVIDGMKIVLNMFWWKLFKNGK